jgi:type I restriction enzyme S subunit
MTSDWQDLRLGDVVELKRGYDLPQQDRTPGRVPIVSSSGITGYHSMAMTRGPGVVTGRYGTLGEVFYLKGDFWPLNTTLYVRDFKGNDPRFISYLLRGLNFLAFSDKAAVPGLNRNHLHEAMVRLPRDIGEQRAIGQVLGVLDDKVELNQQMRATLEAIARALFESWFVDFDPVRAKASGEPPESICRRLGLTPNLLALFPDRLVDSELGEIPEGWEVTSVGTLAIVVKGKSYKSSELGPSTTALVTLKSFCRGGGYRLDGLKEYTGNFKRDQEVFAGDLIVAYTDVTQAADVIGKPALVISDDRYEHLVISLDVAVVRPLRDEYRVFLYGVMSTEAFQRHTRAHTMGTTVLHLAASAVPGFKFACPAESLVQAYAGVATPIFESVDRRVAESRSLAVVRDTLLPKLISGELRIRNAERLISQHV